MTDVVYDVVPRAGVIDLGKQVEGLVTRVVLPNIRRGAGAVQLVHQRSDDQEPYPVPVTEDGDKVFWIVTRSDTAFPGRGQAELQWLGENGEVAKSVTYQTNTTRSMAEPGSVPDEPLKPYTQAVARDAQAAKDAAASAKASAQSAEASSTQAGQSADNAAKTLTKLEDGIASGDFRGQDGKSAYQLAVDAGFDGTETQWLESLKGAPGDTTAADAAAAAAKKAAQEAQKAADASAGSAAQAAESVGGLADDLATLKTENTALKAETARTSRSLEYLWKKSKGIIYDTETVTGAGSSVTVPSGAMDYAALRMVGGMGQRDAENNVLIDAPVDVVKVTGKNLLDFLHAKITKVGWLGEFVRDEEILTLHAINGWSSYWFASPVQGKRISVSFSYRQIDDKTGAADPALTVGTRGKPGYMASDAYRTQKPKKIWTKIACTMISDAYVGVMLRVGTEGANEERTIEIKDFQLELGTTATAYSPYHPETYPIPQAIRDLCPDYGQGTVDAYNYIDFAAKAYHHVGSMSQDGTWTALATPEIIDLSAVWPDDFGVLRVEAGGTIGLHYPALDNGYELAVPSETEIMVEVAKVVGTDG